MVLEHPTDLMNEWMKEHNECKTIASVLVAERLSPAGKKEVWPPPPAVSGKNKTI